MLFDRMAARGRPVATSAAALVASLDFQVTRVERTRLSGPISGTEIGPMAALSAKLKLALAVSAAP